MQKVGKFFDGAIREPVNKDASLIFFNPENGVQHLRNKGVITSTLPLDMKEPPKNTIDYTGVEKGSFVVVGYLGYRIKSGGIKSVKNRSKNRQKIFHWQLRCGCGRYEMRTNVSLRRKKTADYHYDRCRPCQASKKMALTFWGCL